MKLYRFSISLSSGFPATVIDAEFEVVRQAAGSFLVDIGADRKPNRVKKSTLGIVSKGVNFDSHNYLYRSIWCEPELANECKAKVIESIKDAIHKIAWSVHNMEKQLTGRSL